MATGPLPVLSEAGFYEKMAKVDEYIKPIFGSEPKKSHVHKEPTVYDAVKAG